MHRIYAVFSLFLGKKQSYL